MKFGSKIIRSVFFFFLFFALWGCVDNAGKTPEPTKPGVSKEPAMGTLLVRVLDSDLAETPVPDVEITVTPDSLVKTTDSNGKAMFDVPQGTYYVNADVCCIGPGFLHYHIPVIVREKDTVTVKLRACSMCL